MDKLVDTIPQNAYCCLVAKHLQVFLVFCGDVLGIGARIYPELLDHGGLTQSGIAGQVLVHVAVGF
jgi:hypothetical protein